MQESFLENTSSVDPTFYEKLFCTFQPYQSSGLGSALTIKHHICNILLCQLVSSWLHCWTAENLSKNISEIGYPVFGKSCYIIFRAISIFVSILECVPIYLKWLGRVQFLAPPALHTRIGILILWRSNTCAHIIFHLTLNDLIALVKFWVVGFLF